MRGADIIVILLVRDQIVKHALSAGRCSRESEWKWLDVVGLRIAGDVRDQIVNKPCRPEDVLDP